MIGKCECNIPHIKKNKAQTCPPTFPFPIFLHSWPGASSAASHLEEQPLLQRLLNKIGGVPQNSVTKTAC